MRFAKVGLKSYIQLQNINQLQCKSGATVFQMPNLRKALNVVRHCMETTKGFHLIIKQLMKVIMTFFLLLAALKSCKLSPNDAELQQTKTSNSSYDSLSISNSHAALGYDFARQQLSELLKGKGQPFTWDTLIRNPSTTIAMAEPLLFDIFGKENIINERPYEVYLINGYWYLAGTIPKGWNGGAFEIIMSAKDGKIIRLTHYK